MSQPDNHKLLVISVDDPLKAQELLLSMYRLQRSDQIKIHDAVFVRRDDEGHAHVTETTDVTPGRG